MAKGNDKKARCFLMEESDKNKKSPIKLTLPCEFDIEMHTGEISNFSKRLNFQLLSNSSQTRIEQYCEDLINNSKICKEKAQFSREQ